MKKILFGILQHMHSPSFIAVAKKKGWIATQLQDGAVQKFILFSIFAIIFCANAYAETCTPGYYKNGDSCEKCEGFTYSDTYDATACTPCPEPIVYANNRRWNNYWAPGDIHNTVAGCQVAMWSDDPNGTYTLCCSYVNGDYGIGGGHSTQCYTAPESVNRCIGGKYMPGNSWIYGYSLTDLVTKVCIDVEPGYYSPDNDKNRYQCPAGTYSAAGASSCTPCPTGTTSPIGASFCNTCPNLNTIIGTVQATAYASTTNTGATADGNPATYGISGELAFALDYGDKGVIIGHGRCSSEAGTGLWNGANNATEITLKNNLINENGTGRYCYCRLDSYTPVNGSTIALTGAWMFDIDDDSSDKCAFDCADNCGAHLRDAIPTSLDFRSAIFNNVSCPEIGIASTSYVQGMYEAINNSKMAKLNPNSIEFTPDSTPYGFFTEVEGVGDKFRFKREEPTLPFGSYENPTGRMSIWLE